MMILKVSAREFHTILAALRVYQETLDMSQEEMPERFVEIATNAGEVNALDSGEIDALCQRLNLRRGDIHCPACETALNRRCPAPHAQYLESHFWCPTCQRPVFLRQLLDTQIRS